MRGRGHPVGRGRHLPAGHPGAGGTGAYTLMNLLPFAALGWLCLGGIAAAVLRARQPASFKTLGRGFMPSER